MNQDDAPDRRIALSVTASSAGLQNSADDDCEERNRSGDMRNSNHQHMTCSSSQASGRTTRMNPVGSNESMRSPLRIDVANIIGGAWSAKLEQDQSIRASYPFAQQNYPQSNSGHRELIPIDDADNGLARLECNQSGNDRTTGHARISAKTAPRLVDRHHWRHESDRLDCVQRNRLSAVV